MPRSIVKGIAVIFVISGLLYAGNNPEQPPPEVVAELGPNYQLLHQVSFSKEYPSATVADLAHGYDVIKYLLDIKLCPSEPFNKLKGQATILAESEVANLNLLSLDLAGLVV